MMTSALLVALAASSVSQISHDLATETPRSWALEFRYGWYRPFVDSEAGLTQTPYRDTFDNQSMNLFELELDRQIFQKFGSFAFGFSFGYAEKYGKAISYETGAPVETATTTSLKVYPLRALAVYRMDYAAVRWGVPLVPYAKLALMYVPWSMDKNGLAEVTESGTGSGGKWGWGATGGISFQLDILDQKLAKDFDTGTGVNHSYFFFEINRTFVNNFGAPGLVLSSRHFMLGLMLEY